VTKSPVVQVWLITTRPAPVAATAMSLRRLSLVVVLLALTAGCQLTTEPRPADMFLLHTIDGRQLPTNRNGVVVLHEELVLGTDGVATRSTTVQGPSVNTETTNTVSIAYTRAGDVVSLGNYICTTGYPCALHAPEEGSIDGDVLTLMRVPSLSSVSSPVLVYRRPMLD
jgi:hypothetical protein